MNNKNREFIRKRGELEVEFYLQGEDEELVVQLKNWQTIQHFALKIDQTYIENHTDLHSFFSSPSDLLYTFTELFDKLVIQPEGTIILSIKLDAIKINMTKQYAFQLKYEDKGQFEMYRVRIKQLQNQIGEKIEQKDEKISQLMRKNQSLQSEVAVLRAEQKSSSVELFNIKRDSKLKLQEILEKDQEISSLKTLCQDQSEDIEQLNQQISKKNEEISELKTKLGLFNLTLSKKSNSVNEENPHLYSFHYRYTQNSVQVMKKSDNGWANFISNFSIPDGQTTTFTLKMIKMRDGSLSIGIGTKNLFGNNVMDHSDVIAYFCRDGRIFENGQRKQGISHIACNHLFNVQIDRKKQKVSWLLEGTSIGQSSIPTHMQDKQLFLIVRMFWKQDEFQLLF